MLDSTYIISDTKTIRSFQVEMCLSDADPFVASAAQNAWSVVVWSVDTSWYIYRKFTGIIYLYINQ